MNNKRIITKGCFFSKHHNSWVACIGIGGKNKTIGYFKTEEEASKAYINERNILFDKSLYSDYFDIPNYNGIYKISANGKVLSLKRPTPVERKILTNKNGYLYVVLTKDGITKLELIHRLLYKTFVEDIPDDLVIDHIDRNPKNNNIKNLRLVTKSVNSQNSSKVINAKGAFYDKRKNVWYSAISVNGKRMYLGTFRTEEDASNAYRIAKEKLHILPE